MIAKRRSKVATRSNFFIQEFSVLYKDPQLKSRQIRTLFQNNNCNFTRKARFLKGVGPNLTARVKKQEQSWNILGKSHSSPLTARLSIGKRLTNEYEKKEKQ